MRTFTVPGAMRGKMRPKASSFHGFTRVYTPKEQIEFENWVRLNYQRKHPDDAPFPRETQLRVTIICKKKIPADASKKLKALMSSGQVLDTKRPDADNIAKSILDALNTIAFADDNQIVDLRIVKKYGEPEGATVFMEEYKDE